MQFGNIFTPSGRIGRGGWWALVANALVLPWLAFLVSSVAFGAPDGVLLAMMVTPVSLWVLFTASAKRLHDLGRGAFWVWLILVPLGWIVLLAWLGTVPGVYGVNAYGPPESGSPFGRPEFRMESA